MLATLPLEQRASWPMALATPFRWLGVQHWFSFFCHILSLFRFV